MDQIVSSLVAIHYLICELNFTGTLEGGYW